MAGATARTAPYALLAPLTWAAGCSALVDADANRLDLPTPVADAGSTDRDQSPVAVCEVPCDDGVACTRDECAGMQCDHRPDDGACGVGQRCNPGTGCVALRCAQDSDCDDLNVCNGLERCDAAAPGADAETGCVATEPLLCDDGVGCTTDACDPRSGCSFEPSAEACDDGITCTEDICDPAAAVGTLGCSHVERDEWCDYCVSGGSCEAEVGCRALPFSRVRDCDDQDPCTADVCDGRARQCLSALRDDDGDGAAVSAINGVSCGGGDCDDNDPSTFPGAEEVCNGRDDDCDGTVDEACTSQPDRCETAGTIELSGGWARVQGRFGSFESDLGTECGDSGGRDAVFRVEIDGPADVIIDATASEAHTVVAAAPDCGGAAFGRRCNGRVSDAVPSGRLFLHGFEGGALYVLIDAVSPEEVDGFDVTIETRRRAPDSCDGEPLDITGGGVVLGRLQPGPFGSGGRERGCCQGPGGIGAAEAVLQLRSPADGTAEFEVTSTTQGFAPVLYARDGVCTAFDRELLCDGGVELDCTQSSNSVFGSGAATAAAQVRPGDRVFVFVDGALSEADYRLHYRP